MPGKRRKGKTREEMEVIEKQVGVGRESEGTRKVRAKLEKRGFTEGQSKSTKATTAKLIKGHRGTKGKKMPGFQTPGRSPTKRRKKK